MVVALMKYERYNDVDLEIAVDNNPHLAGDEPAALLALFQGELTENEELRGKWQIVDHQYTPENLWVWVRFDAPEWGEKELIRNIQLSYDKYGMSGGYEKVSPAEQKACCQKMATNVTDLLRSLLKLLPDQGNTEETSQKLCILNALSGLERAIDGLTVDDFVNNSHDDDCEAWL